MQKDLNNSVVIQAKKMREYPTSSLAKNNNISKVFAKNSNFLKKVEKTDYEFAKAESVGSTIGEDLTNIYVGSQDYLWGGSTRPETILVASSNRFPKRKIHLSGVLSFRFQQVKGSTKLPASPQTASYEISDQKLYDGDVVNYTFTFRKYSMSSLRPQGTVVVTVTMGYSNGELFITDDRASTLATVEGGVYSGGLKVETIMQDVNPFSDDDYVYETPNGDRYEGYILDFSLTNEMALFLCDVLSEKRNTATTPPLKESVSSTYTLTDGTQRSVDGRLIQKTYKDDEFSLFIQDCQSATTKYDVVVGLTEGSVQSLDGSFSDFRFKEHFTAFAFVKISSNSGERVYADRSISLKSQKNSGGTAYYIEEKNKSYELQTQSTSSGNEFTIEENSLYQEDTAVSNAQISSMNANRILNKFKNGRNTANFPVFYGEYLDSNGVVVYNGIDGYFIKTDDIVEPFTLRVSKTNGETTEVPLYVDSYRQDQDGNQVADGKRFYVTSCQVEYDGGFEINIEVLEKTDLGGENG